MKDKNVVAVLITASVLALATQCLAGLIDWEVRNRYLKEQEAQAQTSSVKMDEKLPQWMQVEPVISTDDEKKYDSNKDGRFQPVESKVYLRRAYQQIQTGAGKNVLDSSVLKEYDTNKDGLITKPESEKMKKDAF